MDAPKRSAEPQFEPDRRWMWWGALGALVLLFAIRLTYAVAFELAEGSGRVGPRVFDETTGAIVGVLPIAVLTGLLQRFPLGAGRWGRSALVIGGAFAPISLGHTWMLMRARSMLGPMFGYAQYAAAAGPARYVYEGMTDLVHTLAIVAAFTAVDAVLARRARERLSFALERSLLEADLRVLRLRLEPHFLFNALNTISSTMYQDVRAADAQLAHLASLLRSAAQTIDAQEVALDTELGALDHYLALLHARFEDRLVVTVDASADARRCLVPSLLLQPLVENAIRHGSLERKGTAQVRIVVVRSGGELAIAVRDDGPGVATDRDPLDTGTGLSSTIQRLRLLYAGAQVVRVGNVPGGFEVAITIPAREAPVSVAAPAAERGPVRAETGVTP